MYAALYTYTQLKHCRVGQTVRIISDLAVLHKLQNDNAMWHDDMIMVSAHVRGVGRNLLRGFPVDSACCEVVPPCVARDFFWRSAIISLSCSVRSHLTDSFYND